MGIYYLTKCQLNLHRMHNKSPKTKILKYFLIVPPVYYYDNIMVGTKINK